MWYIVTRKWWEKRVILIDDQQSGYVVFSYYSSKFFPFKSGIAIFFHARRAAPHFMRAYISNKVQHICRCSRTATTDTCKQTFPLSNTAAPLSLSLTHAPRTTSNFCGLLIKHCTFFHSRKTHPPSIHISLQCRTLANIISSFADYTRKVLCQLFVMVKLVLCVLYSVVFYLPIWI